MTWSICNFYSEIIFDWCYENLFEILLNLEASALLGGVVSWFVLVSSFGAVAAFTAATGAAFRAGVDAVVRPLLPPPILGLCPLNEPDGALRPIRVGISGSYSMFRDVMAPESTKLFLVVVF